MQQQQQAASPIGQAQVSHHEHELPGLAGIANVIRWFESLIMLISGPVLTIGLGIAIVALMTNDKVLDKWPILLYIWAVSQAVGIDSQLVAAWDRVRIAGRNHDWWALFGYLILGCALGYIGFLSAAAFGFQNAFAVTEAQALLRLGIDPNNWQLQRAIVSVALVALSGLLRYHPPIKNTAGKTAEEEERLQAELRLEPLRAQLRNQKVRDLRAAALTAVGRDTPQQPLTQPSPAKPRIVAASYAMPEPHIEEYNYQMAHDGEQDYDYGITGEVLDEVDDDDPYGYKTQEIPAIDLLDGVASSGTRQRVRGVNNSGPPNASSGRSKAVRDARDAIQKDAERIRKQQIRKATHAILDERYAAGTLKGLSDRELARLVGQRLNLEKHPNGNTVSRLRGPWQSSRTHKAAILATDMGDDLPPMEPQELRELQEVGW